MKKIFIVALLAFIGLQLSAQNRDKDQKVDMKALIPAEKPAKVVRDVWRQKDLSADELYCTIPLHGCRYLKVRF